MLKNKKGLASVIAISLIIIISVIATISFQNWYGQYSTKTLTSVEKKSEQGNTIKISSVIGTDLYVLNSQNINTSLENIKIGEINCNLSKNLSSGMNKIDVSECLCKNENVAPEVVLISKNQITSKKILLKDFEITPKPILSLLSNTSSILWGEDINLTWNAQNVETCNASGSWSGNKVLIGTQILNNLLTSQTYILECNGPYGNILKSITINVGNQDIYPNTFKFTNLTNQNLSTDIISESILLTDFDGNLTASITGDGNPQISINGESWNNIISNVQVDDYLQIKITTNESILTSFSTNLQLGGSNYSWSVQTKNMSFDWTTSVWSSCTANPIWSAWSACSVSCGGGVQTRTCSGTTGTQTRTVDCLRNDSTIVVDSFCESIKPDESQSCSENCIGVSSQSCNTQSCVQIWPNMGCCNLPSYADSVTRQWCINTAISTGGYVSYKYAENGDVEGSGRCYYGSSTCSWCSRTGSQDTYHP